jgi:hypothetical protein
MVTDAAGQSTAYLNAVSSQASDLTVKVAVDKRPDGGGYFVSLIGRRVGTNNDYRAKVWISATGQVTLYLVRVLGGAETTLTSYVVPGVTFNAGDQLQIRLQVSGVSPTVLQAKVWRAADPEPAAWASTFTDATASVLQASGSMGLLVYVSRTSTVGTVTSGFSSFLAREAQ